jgi:hypothetical protein
LLLVLEVFVLMALLVLPSLLSQFHALQLSASEAKPTWPSASDIGA